MFSGKSADGVSLTGECLLLSSLGGGVWRTCWLGQGQEAAEMDAPTALGDTTHQRGINVPPSSAREQ